MEALQEQPVGTFTLRLSSGVNGLGITYKTRQEKLQHILLIRTGKERYRIGKSDREVLIFRFIRAWDKLKYLYTPNRLIQKKVVF